MTVGSTLYWRSLAAGWLLLTVVAFAEGDPPRGLLELALAVLLVGTGSCEQSSRRHLCWLVASGLGSALFVGASLTRLT